MESLTLILLVGCTALMLTAQSAEGIRCYVCIGSGCGDPFDKNANGIIVADNCVSCGKTDVKDLVTRACLPAATDMGCQEEGDVSACMCDEDLCNGSTRVTAPLAFLGFLTLIALFFRNL